MSSARRAVAYLRWGDGPEPAVRPEAQRVAIEAWAERERVEIAAWQSDAGIEASTPIAERPGLLVAYRAIREQEAGILVAARADRFARDELVGWLIARAALGEGATLHTADGSRTPTRGTPDGDALLPQEPVGFTRGTIALARAYDQVTFRARVRASLAARRALGQRVGTIPFGYRLAGDGLHLERDDGEQAILATVRALSAEGLSQRAIVARLAEQGVTGRTGAPLGQTQVAKLLRAAS